MNCKIVCSCGCSVLFSQKNIEKIACFSCPACGQNLSETYINKAKQCVSLLDECRHVKREKTVHDGFVDTTRPFVITFEP